jgi:molybdate transport system ATP-binding protein
MIRVDLQKHFKQSSLHLSFHCKTNRTVVFGPSGGGKSLLLKIIAGFFQPDEGEIQVNGKTLFSSKRQINLPIYLREIGYLPQEYTLFPNMTVRENILYAVKARKLKWDNLEFLTLMEKFGLQLHLDDYPHRLSGGQKQRAALARLILIKPRLLLLDEPFSALDTPIRESLRELVMEEVDRNNIPSLFVTHDTEEAFVFGKELVLVEKGKVIESGYQDQVFSFPKQVETAQRLGFSNVWAIQDRDDDSVQIKGGNRFMIEKNTSPQAGFVCIRPENIMILRGNKNNDIGDRDNVFSGILTNVHNRGRYFRLEFESENSLELNIHIPDYMFTRLELYEGKSIMVSIRKNLVILCDSKTGTK